MRVNSESVSRKDANDLFKDCYNTLNQPPNLPILGDFLKLGDTPRPPTGSILHLFISGLRIMAILIHRYGSIALV